MEKQQEISKEVQQQKLKDEGVYVEEAMAILASPMDLYRFWKDPTKFKLFTDQLESVVVLSETRSHWVWKALKGQVRYEWDSEIVEDVPGQKIAWKALKDSEVYNSGAVSFRELPFQRGTEVRVQLAFEMPVGKMAGVVEKVLGESPQRNLKMSLIKLRELFEAGEIPRVEGQSAGRSRKHETKTALH